jgi:putative spermidine/putrescine transport system substrate-binding protein
MWRGDPAVNAYVDGWAAPRLRERHGIRLRAVEGVGPEIVNQLVVEREAGARGSADLVWINGENFHNLRREGLLLGPWAHRLPSGAFVDSASAIVARDFEQDPAGFEAPWGIAQLVLVYDAERMPRPPRSVAELGWWIRRNPGRFTHDQAFTGVAFLKTLLYALGGGVDRFRGGFDEAVYRSGSRPVWDWLEDHRRHFWRRGESYPAGVAELHRLFASGEVDFTMSYNPNETAAKVRQGVFPPDARPLLLRDGTPANAHFLAIPFNARNQTGAMVVADFLLSPEAQLEKARLDGWGDLTVLAPERLPRDWRARFEAAARAGRDDPLVPPRDSLSRYARPEVHPRYQERLLEDWRARIRAAPR